MEPRNVYNYVINLAHFKALSTDLWDKNVMPEHGKDDKLFELEVVDVVYSLESRVSGYSQTFSIFLGRENII